MAIDHDTHDPLSLVAASDRDRNARHQRYSHLWRMKPQQRVTAMWRGELTFGECLAWAARRPHEVPLIGGEYAFIVMRTPEWLDAS